MMMRRRRPTVTVDELAQSLTCQVCKESFPTAKDLRVHVMQLHLPHAIRRSPFDILEYQAWRTQQHSPDSTLPLFPISTTASATDHVYDAQPETKLHLTLQLKFPLLGMGDRLSSLPDAILCHVLSFLPTKQAVATSVVSKRWKPLWRSVSTLDLYDHDLHFYRRGIKAYSGFVQGVNAVIRGLHHPIQKLRLMCVSYFTDAANVTLWVNAAVQRRVHHLDLFISFQFGAPPLNLSSIFNCKTLVVLKLRGMRMELEPISSVYLPSLHVLHLESLTFYEFGCLAKLLSECPVLEDFKEKGLSFGSSFYTSEDVTREFKTIGKLLRAHISETHTKIMLEVVNNVNFLKIDRIDHSLGNSYRIEVPGPHVFPMFHNLTHIELEYINYNNDWSELVELLKCCPKLQVIVIDQPNFDDELSEELENWPYTPSFPECILLHLEECYLNDYRGTKGEFQFARHVMQNGRFLKKMTICSGYGIDQQGRLELLEKLSSCTRQNATCELYFE